MSNEIPCPRLEFRWEKVSEDWLERLCVYSLVLPLKKHDIRRTDVEGNPKELRLEIGRTKVKSGEGPVFDGGVDVPLRDGAHAHWDNEALGGHLPVVAICEDTWSIVGDPGRQDA